MPGNNENGHRIWWRDPTKIAAVVTTLALMGTFVYSRERQLVVLSERIMTFEARGDERVQDVTSKIEAGKQLALLNERAIQTMNERLANDEASIRENYNRITRIEAIIDRLFPQGASQPPPVRK